MRTILRLHSLPSRRKHGSASYVWPATYLGNRMPVISRSTRPCHPMSLWTLGSSLRVQATKGISEDSSQRSGDMDQCQGYWPDDSVGALLKIMFLLQRCR